MNWKKIYLFLALTFLISWSYALIIKVLNIQLSSITGIALIALGYMTGPAVSAIIVQKFYSKRPLTEIGLRIDFRKYKWYLVTILIFVSLTILTLGTVGFFGNVLHVSQFGLIDFDQARFLKRFAELLTAAGQKVEMTQFQQLTPLLFLIITVVSSIFNGFTFNIIPTLGEELGWRGLLLTETKNMGFWKSNLFIGIIWGLWHAPIIAMGHNFPNHPILGIFWFCLFTTAVSPLFAYARLRTKSILGPTVLHGMINASGSVYFILIQNPNELFSTIAGLAGGIAAIILVLVITTLDKSVIRNYQQELTNI